MEVVKERNPVWYASFTGAGARSIVLFPLRSQEHLLGYIWVLNFNAEKAMDIKEILELTTFILGSELGNYLLVDRLKILSSRDMLTGVMNRNEMNKYVDSLCAGEKTLPDPVGVIFADLNGLKAVNDRDGHVAGDNLLRNAANALREVFDENTIFRAGGDEFSIIVEGMEEEELRNRVGLIRSAEEKYVGVSFALGYSHEPDSRNVRTALRHADENMYEDKRLYYERHPERKR